MAAINSKLSPVKAIKKFHRLGKDVQRKNATIENLRVLKSELRWHQKKVKRLQKLILDITKDLAIMTDSEDDAAAGGAHGGIGAHKRSIGGRVDGVAAGRHFSFFPRNRAHTCTRFTSKIDNRGPPGGYAIAFPGAL